MENVLPAPHFCKNNAFFKPFFFFLSNMTMKFILTQDSCERIDIIRLE
jgi:hypothetical protein